MKGQPMTATGVTTTVTTLAEFALAAEAKGQTIPDILLHEYLIAMRAETRAVEAKDRLADAMKEYMKSQSTDRLESAEAKAKLSDVKNRSSFNFDAFKADHPELFVIYFVPGEGTHESFKVTPKA